MGLPSDAAGRAGRRWAGPGVALLALGLGLVAFRLDRLSHATNADGSPSWAMCDFRSAVYYPSVEFLSGLDPYDRQQFLERHPNDDAFPLYLPGVLVLHAPFALLSGATAAHAFQLWTIGLMLVTAVVALRMNGFDPTAGAVLMVMALMTLSRPGHMNLLVGQDTLLYVLGTYLALRGRHRGDVWSGLGLAVASLKPTFGAPLAVLMLARGRVRAVGYGALIAAVINLPPLLILLRLGGGPAGFLHALLANFGGWRQESSVDPSKSLFVLSASGVVSRLLGRPLGFWGELGLVGLTLGIAAAALRTLDRRRDTYCEPLAVGVVCLAILIAFHHQPYDLLLLIHPAIAVIGHRYPATFDGRWLHGTLVTLLALLGFNYLATTSGVEVLDLTGRWYAAVTSVNGLALMAIFATMVWTIFTTAEAAGEPSGHLRPPRGGG